MLIIDVSFCSLDGNVIVTDASTIGLAPGEWPDFIAVTEVVGSGQEGLLFGPNKKFLEHVTIYYSKSGFEELHVLND